MLTNKGGKMPPLLVLRRCVTLHRASVPRNRDRAVWRRGL